MVSDKVEVYQDDRNIEGMKRSAPVLFTRPGQLYGHGRRAMPWWLQEIDRPFDHWAVLTRVQWGEKEKSRYVFHYKGVGPQEVRFADLGLPADRQYVVFEFWTQRFLGEFKGAFTAPAMDEGTGLQTFAIRRARPHPWVLSTTRHLSQGGVSLLEVSWDPARRVLAGRSAVVAGDPYALTLCRPEGFRARAATVDGRAVEVENGPGTAVLRVVPSATGTVAWEVAFER